MIQIVLFSLFHLLPLHFVSDVGVFIRVDTERSCGGVVVVYLWGAVVDRGDGLLAFGVVVVDFTLLGRLFPFHNQYILMTYKTTPV